MLTRRRFVGTMTVLTAACGVGLGGDLVRRRRLTVDQIVTDTIRPLKGAKVLLGAAEGTRLPGVVVDVTVARRPARHGAPATEQISVLIAPDRDDVPAGCYSLETDDVTVDRLTFLPVGGFGRERRLEAVITCIV